MNLKIIKSKQRKFFLYYFERRKIVIFAPRILWRMEKKLKKNIFFFIKLRKKERNTSHPLKHTPLRIKVLRVQSPFRQLTLWLYDAFLEVLTVHGNELRLFKSQGFPPTLTIHVTRLTQKVLFLPSLAWRDVVTRTREQTDTLR